MKECIIRWDRREAVIYDFFQIVSDVNRDRGGFHFDSFARQGLNWSRAVSFHAVANLRAETEDAGNRSK